MEKDFNDQVLSEEQLGNVQGGLGGCGDEKVVTNCMFPGCSWNYAGPIDKAAIAQ